MDLGLQYNKASGACASSQGMYMPQTLRDQLEQKQLTLQKSLATIEKALKALDTHTELEGFLNIIQEAQYV